MHVIYHDIVCVMAIGGAVRAASLSSLLRNSDFVSLHVPSTPETVGMIGPDELAKMKSSAHIINASRGNVIDLLALKQALESGSISGAAIDVFPSEPKVNGPWNDSIFTLVEETTHKHDNKSNSSPLNLILTPHIGGSTEEAQRAIGAEVASAIIGYVNNGSTIGCVNFPEINLFAQSEMKNTRGGSFLASPSLVNESGMLTKSPVKLTRTLSWEFLGKQTEKVNDKSPQIACRVLNIHHNTPGVLCHVNDALKMFNIAKQTCESLGPFSYLAMDLIIEDEKSVKVIYDLISQIPASIKTRVIF